MPKGYWIYSFWLASIVIVGIGGFVVGSQETPPKLLASIDEALSNIFKESNTNYVEILDVGNYSPPDVEIEVRTIATLGEVETTSVDQEVNSFEECAVDLDNSPQVGAVIINEVAWMGGLESQDLSHNDEWIELKNISPVGVNISDWQIKDALGDINIVFPNGSVIPPGDFLLLERSDDNSVPGIIADLIYAGALANENETLGLFDADCNLVDRVDANPSWPSGDNTNRRTMERSMSLEWHTFSGAVEEGVLGTPKAANSQEVITEENDVEEEVEDISNFNLCEDTNDNPTKEVFINEVSWAGRSDNTSEEWIELYNQGGDKSLEGWQLFDKDRSIVIIFTEEDKIDDYYLLRRILESEDPNKKWEIGGASVDKTYTGVIQNSEEELRLFNENCVLVDKVINVGSNWGNIGGSAPPEYRTAERTDDNEWHTYNGTGAGGIMGTPGEENSTPSENTQPIKSSGGGSGGSSVEPVESDEDETCQQDDLNEPTRTVLINEVAWGGSASSTSDEWIELSTNIDRGLSLSGWQLLDKDEEIRISLSGRVEDYLLLKRILVSESPDDIYTVGTMPADITFTGTINNEEETLRLFDASCNLVDEVVDVGIGWGNIGGTASPDYKSAERIDSNTWGPYVGEGGDIMGTPREENSTLDNDEGGDQSEEEPEDDDGGEGDDEEEPVPEEPAPEEPPVVIDLEITSVIYDADGADEGKERITIQNNSASTVDISSFSIQYLKGGVGYESISKKNFEGGHEILGGGEFVIGANCSGTIPCEGVNMSWSQALGNTSGNVYLVSDQEGVLSAEDQEILDSFSY
ncbi:MAG: lamin tail domain-containing protein [Candidatus Colwellbacteria bacterium]|nr:lamin tail domain-containing protein [Candidatus Colwellbacteria bacterium]